MDIDVILKALRRKYDETEPIYFFARTLFRESADLIESLRAEAARIFLRVTDVRVERLRDDMPLFDVWDEGTPPMPGNNDPDGAVNHKDFAYLWDSTVKAADLPVYGWDANPWVWVYKFERVIDSDDALSECEIIGNVHDNPELMGGDAL